MSATKYLVSKKAKIIRSAPIDVSEDGFYVVNPKLAQRIINAQPHFDFVFEDDQLVDIVELEKPPEPPPEPSEIEILLRDNQLLKAQNQALSEQADFHEDVLEEIILAMYS